MREVVWHKVALFLIWCSAFFSPTYEYLFFIGCLVSLDTFMGVAAAVKRKRYITAKAFDVVVKSIYYFSAIGVSHWIENLFDLGLALKITAGYIAFIELSSIDENYFKMTGKRLFKYIIDKLKR